MQADTVKNGPGLIFWLSFAWIVVVLFSAVTAGWWNVPASDLMDWDNLSAFPGAHNHNAVLQNSGEGQQMKYVYLLGTDTLGRDIVSRLIYGARISLSVGLLSSLIGFLLGGILGCAAGYYRGRLDILIVACMDIILAFPGLVLLLAITFYFGSSLYNLILSLGFLTIPAFCRVARAKTLTLSDLEFVQAARLSGAGNVLILLREIVPNIIVPMAAYGLVVVSFMIMTEGALSFLGLGVAAPTPSWGGMVADGREVLEDAPHVSMIPAGVLFLTILSFNLIGDSLRQIAEKRTGQL
jgi:peptide/nickel transport system permease protein